MISIVIRNRNEASFLERTLKVITTLYAGQYDEIILIDNNSTDNSVEVGVKYGCRIHNIDKFTYGRAINLGISLASNPYVLLLSSHAVPVGIDFFKQTLIIAQQHADMAGLRFVNSFEDLERACKNDFVVKNTLDFGLMAACCLVSKKVWEQHSFNEELVASEDKEWSLRVGEAGFKIYNINESFFYYLDRKGKSSLRRFELETTANYQLKRKKYDTVFHILWSFIYSILGVCKAFVNSLYFEMRLMFVKLRIRRRVNTFIK